MKNLSTSAFYLENMQLSTNNPHCLVTTHCPFPPAPCLCGEADAAALHADL